MAMTRTALAIGSVLLLSGLGGYGLSSLRSLAEPVGVADAAPPAAAEDDPSNPQSPPPAAVARSDPRDAQAMLPAAAAPLRRISLVRQSWKRGGMGSQALATFTVHNRNRFPIKDLEILCTFRSDDGSYRTERRRVLPDTVRRRKTFTDTLVGHVNLNATYGKCRLLGARRA